MTPAGCLAEVYTLKTSSSSWAGRQPPGGNQRIPGSVSPSLWNAAVSSVKWMETPRLDVAAETTWGRTLLSENVLERQEAAPLWMLCGAPSRDSKLPQLFRLLGRTASQDSVCDRPASLTVRAGCRKTIPPAPCGQEGWHC